MANTYELTRPKQWEAPERAAVEQHLGEVEKALGSLSAGVDTVSTNLNEKISSVSTDLDGRITSVSSTLDGKINNLSSTLTGKINSVAAAQEVVVGYYTGNDAANRDIKLGFRPRAVLVEDESGLRMSYGVRHGTLVVDGMPVSDDSVLLITATGFQTRQVSSQSELNSSNTVYVYMAIK